MDELFRILQGLLIGEGNPRDIGIRLLIYVVVVLSSTVLFYFRRDVKGILDRLEKLGTSYSDVQGYAHRIEVSFIEYKKSLHDMLENHLTEMRKDHYDLRVLILNLDKQLTKTSLELGQHQAILQSSSEHINKNIVHLEGRISDAIKHLEDSHETREEVYGLIKTLKKIEGDQEKNFGRIILLESFTSRYDVILKGLEKAMIAKKYERK